MWEVVPNKNCTLTKILVKYFNIEKEKKEKNESNQEEINWCLKRRKIVLCWCVRIKNIVNEN